MCRIAGLNCPLNSSSSALRKNITAMTDKMKHGGPDDSGIYIDKTNAVALGNRSILADPRNKNIKGILNARIKKRESFRPFAPSILEEHASTWFEDSHPVPFMEKVYFVKPDKRKLIPSVVHEDGTGRLQTVSENLNDIIIL